MFDDEITQKIVMGKHECRRMREKEKEWETY